MSIKPEDCPICTQIRSGGKDPLTANYHCPSCIGRMASKHRQTEFAMSAISLGIEKGGFNLDRLTEEWLNWRWPNADAKKRAELSARFKEMYDSFRIEMERKKEEKESTRNANVAAGQLF